MGPVSYKLFEFDYPNKPFLMSGEVEMLSIKLKELSDGQKELMTELRLMEDGMKEIKISVMGNINAGNEGLTHRVKELEVKVHHFDKVYYKGLMMITIVGAIWSMALPFIIAFLMKKFGL